jgi:hypothetical protein
LVIKDVVMYADKKIETTKSVIQNWKIRQKNENRNS